MRFFSQKHLLDMLFKLKYLTSARLLAQSQMSCLNQNEMSYLLLPKILCLFHFVDILCQT